MKNIYKKESVLLKDNSANPIISDSVAVLKEAGYSDEHIRQFTDDAIDILDDYAELIGEGVTVEYSLVKRFTRIKLSLKIPGDPYDPFNSGNNAKRRKLGNIVTINLNSETASVSYNYVLGNNVIAVSIPLSERKKAIYKDPTVIAIVLGIVLGIVCKQMPQSTSNFFVEDLAAPLMSIILSTLSGIMGPVIFISMTTSIIALDSINDLTDLGFKIMRRFVYTTLFLIGVSIIVSAFFFKSLGTGTISFSPQQLVRMILDVIPTNLFVPFVQNNTAQLVILGLLLGTALLILEDRVSELNALLLQINEWMMSAMKIILMALPAIPFLSIFTAVARGNFSEFLEGWRFILASYIVYIVTILIKAIKTSIKTGISIPKFWNKIRPAVKMAFTTSSVSAPVKTIYEISEKEFNIRQEFTSFWIPMCSALFSPKTTINLIIAAFMVAEMTGIAITNSFIAVLIIVTLELSIASPGTTSAWAIMFSTLSMPASYVGFFTVYRIFTNNFSAGYTIAYDMLEEVEAAYRLDKIDKQDG